MYKSYSYEYIKWQNCWVCEPEYAFHNVDAFQELVTCYYI